VLRPHHEVRAGRESLIGQSAEGVEDEPAIDDEFEPPIRAQMQGHAAGAGEVQLGHATGGDVLQQLVFSQPNGRGRGVLARRRPQVGIVDRHRVHLRRRQRHAGQERLADMREVAVGVAGRCHALVDLHQLQPGPGEVQPRQVA
jgi:hypothetical protein